MNRKNEGAFEKHKSAQKEETGIQLLDTTGQETIHLPESTKQRTMKDLQKVYSVPSKRAAMIKTKFPDFLWEKMCQARVCRWGKERPKKGAKPAFHDAARFGKIARFWFPENLVPVVRQSPAQDLPLDEQTVLSSIFTINRTAKRYRDGASNAYENHEWRSARRCSNQKTRLYSLKDEGILFAVKNFWLTPIEFSKPLTVYRGGGFCFHSLLMPIGIDLPILDPWNGQIDSKPKSVDEMRLKDAISLLEKLGEQDRSNYIVNRFETYPKTFCHRELLEEDEKTIDFVDDLGEIYWPEDEE